MAPAGRAGRAETGDGAPPVTAEGFKTLDSRDYGRATMTFMIYGD